MGANAKDFVYDEHDLIHGYVLVEESLVGLVVS